jgi:acetylornithine deacetylase
MNDLKTIKSNCIHLLKQLIQTPSFSKEEDGTAAVIYDFLLQRGVQVQRHLNNVWCTNKHFDASKPTIVLNSHHDTVKPNPGYTYDPFAATEVDGKIIGLGSNDAGASLVSLIATFLYFHDQKDLNYNLVLAASAEEEISGTNGIAALLSNNEFLDYVRQFSEHPLRGWGCIVGEPTQMQMAVAERGLLVLDAIAHGEAGHAARAEGKNAIYKAMKDIEWFQSYQFEKVSELLGPVKMTVTSIETVNKAHNVVPSECRFIVDIRINELYTHEEVIDTIKQNVLSEIRPRSCRLRSSMIALDHPLVKAGLSLGRTYYGSPTASDKALMPFPALKIGPGDSARSHTADEYIYIREIEEGIELYIKLLDKVLNNSCNS